jgi:ABC-2 type transport system permease protein
MIAALYGEFRKFTSVRSTYYVSIIALLLSGFFAFWGTFKGGPLYSPTTIQTQAADFVTVVAVFVGILSILLICHEYRYNTISYTLTSSNSRLRILFAKLIMTGGYALIMTLLTLILTMGMVTVGAQVAGHELGTQTIDLFSLSWKSIVYMIGSAWFGLTLGFLSRSLVFAIVAFFLVPTVESIFHGLLKVSNNYMPISAQSQIMSPVASPDTFSPLASAGVFGAYLAVALIVAAILFVRRDAN